MKNNNNLQTLFVGIDPHKQKHVLTAINPFGERIGTLAFDNAAPGFKKALIQIRKFSEEQKTHAADRH